MGRRRKKRIKGQNRIMREERKKKRYRDYHYKKDFLDMLDKWEIYKKPGIITIEDVHGLSKALQVGGIITDVICVDEIPLPAFDPSVFKK